MKFEVPQRQQIASDPDSALFVRSGPFHHFLRSANAELVSGGPFPCPFDGKDGGSQLIAESGSWGTRCIRKRAVPETASSGTELTFGAQKGLLRYATRFQRHSVQKTGVFGTEGIFGTRNPLLRYGVLFISEERSAGNATLRSFFDIRQELSTYACTLAERPGKAGRGHLSALPCSAALFAHVPSAHHKSHAERWMFLS